jgi:hypothetical protein
MQVQYLVMTSMETLASLLSDMHFATHLASSEPAKAKVVAQSTDSKAAADSRAFIVIVSMGFVLGACASMRQAYAKHQGTFAAFQSCADPVAAEAAYIRGRQTFPAYFDSMEFIDQGKRGVVNMPW